jgi:hypothetical protein
MADDEILCIMEADQLAMKVEELGKMMPFVLCHHLFIGLANPTTGRNLHQA